jgi:hypothetical protein
MIWPRVAEAYGGLLRTLAPVAKAALMQPA